jgi:hypothetical protein
MFIVTILKVIESREDELEKNTHRGEDIVENNDRVEGNRKYKHHIFNAPKDLT